MKTYKFVQPDETRNELVQILVRGLGRSLKVEEIQTIYHLGDCGIETRLVLTDLFKQLVDKK